MSDSFRLHGLQLPRLPCPSPTPGVYSNSCPSSQGSHPTISSSVIPFLFPPLIFSSIRVFSHESVLRIWWAKYWSFSFSISPSNEYSGLIYFRTEWLDLLAVQGTQEFSPIPQFKNINSLALSLLYGRTLTPYMTTGKTTAFTRQTFLGKVMSLLFNMLSRFGHSFSSKEQMSFDFMAEVNHLQWFWSLRAIRLLKKKKFSYW